jgi:uncharacterized OB-fold protein
MHTMRPDGFPPPIDLPRLRGQGVRDAAIAQHTDIPLDEIRIGQKVKVEFRRIREEGQAGILCYGYKCVPAE